MIYPSNGLMNKTINRIVLFAGIIAAALVTASGVTQVASAQAVPSTSSSASSQPNGATTSASACQVYGSCTSSGGGAGVSVGPILGLTITANGQGTSSSGGSSSSGSGGTFTTCPALPSFTVGGACTRAP